MAFIDSRMVNGPDGKNVFDSLNEHASSLADKTSQINGIATVIATSYGAKGDGTTIDTVAIKNSIDALPDGGTYVLPKGLYILNDRVFITKNNCTFYFYGDFKMAGGIATPYGLLTIGGSNNKFYYLNIDGNSTDPTVIDGMAYGVTANLVIGTSAKNLSFYNTSMTNTMYSAIIYNGKASNILFDTITFKNIGEHCNYISGGLNDEITYKNVYVEDIGLKTTDHVHEGYFIKSRGDSYGNNTNFHIKNVRQYQNQDPSYIVCLMALQELDGCDIDDVRLNGKMYGFTGTSTAGRMTINNLDNRGCTLGKLFYANSFINSDITMKNSYITGYQTELNTCHKFDNCTFIVHPSGWSLSDVTTWATKYDLIFNNCEFVFSTGKIVYNTVNQNVFFRNCYFRTTSTTSVADGCLSIGVTSFNSANTIEIIGGSCTTDNFSYFVYGYNNCNLKIQNFTYSVVPRGNSFGTLTLINVTSLKSLSVKSGTYVSLIANSVYQNGVNFAEYKGQLTIPNGGTASPTVDLQYKLIRTLQLSDVILTPIGDVGTVRYYPVVSGTTLSVACTPAAASELTFNVLVKANS